MDGRWIGRDKINIKNIYTFVLDSPLIQLDYLGLDAIIISSGIDDDGIGHDRYWRNFIDTALMRHTQFLEREHYREPIEWFVEKSTYNKRCSNDGENKGKYWNKIKALAASRKLILREYSSKEELFKKLKTLKNGQERPRGSVSHLVYIGHGYYYALALNINDPKQNVTYEEIRNESFFNPQYFNDKPRIELETCHSASVSQPWAKHRIEISIAQLMSRLYSNSYVRGYDGKLDFSGVPNNIYPYPGRSVDPEVWLRSKTPSMKEFGFDDVSQKKSTWSPYIRTHNRLNY